MGEPVWALARRFPCQGDWSEEDYLTFPCEQSRMEFEDGFIEVLPVPTDTHQAILDLLMEILRAYARKVGGRARSAGLRVRLRAGRFREPDLVFLAKEHLHLRGEEYWSGADLVMEIVSDSAEDRERDLVKKRREYAEAGVAEYWIIDPANETITVLGLQAGSYAERGVYKRGETATSATFEGLAADVSETLDAD